MNTPLLSRRALLRTVGAAAVGAPLSALAQGRCMTTFGSPSCNTADVAPPFGPTGWKTVALDHVTFNMADYRKEAAFYIALMGWSLRSDDGAQAVLDIGDWGSALFKKGDGKTTVESFSFVVERQSDRIGAARARPLARRRSWPERVRKLLGEGSGWVADSDLQRPRPGCRAARVTSDREARRAAAVRGHRMEDGVARSLLVQRHRL
jgi:catechol 2,3-dioxygenase-like lactoylglutathione lyase family enzyme